MCGIAGFLRKEPDTNRDELNTIITKMSNTLVHRGPDDAGAWCDEASGIALGHRRLSIIDLSAAGHQPMVSANGRFVVVMNGEIYNHNELKQEEGIADYPFRGHSDTEVALAAIQNWGIEKAHKEFIGMFAFAVWDREDKTLYLSRDRLGEKPLYYGFLGGSLLFASELKALRVHPDWDAAINNYAIALLARYSYIPAPYSIFREIKKLAPGTILKYSPGKRDMEPELTTYWSCEEVVLDAISKNRNRDEKEAVDELDMLLTDTIRGKMIADVSLGAFLSGGIDSSLIAALMQKESTVPVKTFSIGFYEKEYNEATYAKEVAEYLGTDHTELYVTPEETWSVIPNIPKLFDEPFSDSSQIPTFLLSELTRKNVKVALSGDGGDELFGGYNRYFAAIELLNNIDKFPSVIRKQLGNAVLWLGASRIDSIYKVVKPLLPGKYKFEHLGMKLQQLVKEWDSLSIDSIYPNMISLWTRPSEIVNGTEDPDILSGFMTTAERIRHFSERMMFLDTVTYLPNDILVKVDRTSMAVSLEVRVPFLDHRIVEYIWNLPDHFKIRNGKGKLLLRQVLDRYVPGRLVNRPKMGFGVPIDHWLRGPMREWAENLISRERLNREGFFNPDPIREKWEQHLEGKLSWHYMLWPVLMFQAWHEHWMEN